MRIRVQASVPRSLLVWLANLLIVGGAVCLVLAGWPILEGRLYQHFQGIEFAKATAGGAEDSSVSPSPSAPVRQVSVSDTSASAMHPLMRPHFADLFHPDPQLIGRLEAPAIDLSVLVREGVDDDTLSRAVGHVPETALPGQPGDFVVLGHRDTFFHALRKIKRGDALRVRTRDAEFTYRVDALQITGPDELRLDAGPDPSLTLITCYPFTYIGPAPRRFVVHARLATTAGSRPKPHTTR